MLAFACCIYGIHGEEGGEVGQASTPMHMQKDGDVPVDQAAISVPSSSSDSNEDLKLLSADTLWERLSLSLLKSFAMLRSSELFDIVADYPDSIRAVREFKQVRANSRVLRPVCHVPCAKSHLQSPVCPVSWILTRVCISAQ